MAEALDVYGDGARRGRRAGRPPGPAASRSAAALRAAAAQAAGRPRPAGSRLAVVSAADPVDRATGRLVHLPDAPFLVGELDPVDVLRRIVDGPVAGRQRRQLGRAGRARRRDDRAARRLRLPLPRRGPRLRGRQRRRGPPRPRRPGRRDRAPRHHRARGRAMPFTEVFDELGLRQPRINGHRRRPPARRPPPTARRRGGRPPATPSAAAVSGVLAAVVALTDPQVVIVGGGWGGNPVILDTIRTTVAAGPATSPSGPPR